MFVNSKFRKVILQKYFLNPSQKVFVNTRPLLYLNKKFKEPTKFLITAACNAFLRVTAVA
jgi:hypothetical protein